MSAGLCIAAFGGAVLAALPVADFTLSWTHSVAKTEWREAWHVADDRRLVLTEARVQGTGAGMEPPSTAWLADGWWVWAPDLPPQECVVLAASDYTAEHTVCAGGECRTLSGWIGGPPNGPVELRACP